MASIRAGMAVWVGVAALSTALAVAPPPAGGRAVVATDHRLASEAGAEVLRRGGNAVDAAVAAALSAGVVQPAGSGLGGGGFAVGVMTGDSPFVLDFREVAPETATRGMFLASDGEVDRDASRIGGRAVAIPGEARGLAKLVADHGRTSLKQIAAPAIRQASRGFYVGPHLAGALSRTRFSSIQQLFAAGGEVAGEGARVQRPALARTLSDWARTRGESMYTGSGGRAMIGAIQEAGGGMTLENLGAYEVKDREPLVGRYRGYTIVTMPPPSSGGVVLLQMLAVLEGWDLTQLGHNSSDHVHLMAEAMKHAYADRAHHLGDPDFVEVPVGRLLSTERVSEVQRAIWPTKTFPTERYGALIEPPRDAGTQHISAVDAEGNAVALTTTINTSFGSGVVVAGLGVILNNEMDDFAAAPGVPNAFGLVGGEANAIEPGKRPLSSMTPTIVLDSDGQVVLVVGASGGSTIISATLQVLVSILDFGMDPQEAVAAPRVHHQWLPESLWLEPGYPDDVVRSLTARGHEIVRRDGFSSVQVATRQGGRWVAGSDPRKGGWPAALP